MNANDVITQAKVEFYPPSHIDKAAFREAVLHKPLWDDMAPPRAMSNGTMSELYREGDIVVANAARVPSCGRADHDAVYSGAVSDVTWRRDAENKPEMLMGYGAIDNTDPSVCSGNEARKRQTVANDLKWDASEIAEIPSDTNDSVFKTLAQQNQIWHQALQQPNSAKSRKQKSVQFTVEPLVYKPSPTINQLDETLLTNHACPMESEMGKSRPEPLVIADDINDINSPKSPKSPKSPLASSDESYYDTASSTSSTAALLKKAAQSIPEESHLQEQILKDAIADIKKTKSTNIAIKNIPTGVGIETRPIHPEFSTGIGKALLSETLDQVKRSLEELAPGHDCEKSIFLSKSSQKLRNNYLKNLTVLCLSFMMVYCSFFSLRNLQSSINHKDGLGLIAMASMGGGFIVGCIVGTSIVSKVRPKWSLLGAMVGFLIYILANFHATFYTLIPATVLLGMTMATLWIAQGTYLTSIAITYAALTSNKPDHILALFNGFSLFLLQVAQIIGNLMSSLIINNSGDALFESGSSRETSFFSEYVPPIVQPEPPDSSKFLGTQTTVYEHRPSLPRGGRDSHMAYDEFLEGNQSFTSRRLPIHHIARPLISDDDDNQPQLWNISICGSNYHHIYNIDHNSVEIPFQTLFILLGIFTLLTLLGMLLLGVFLDKLDVIFQKKKTTTCQQMMDIAKLHKQPPMILFIPLCIFLGVQEAFIYGEFTKGFVACPLGLHMIGYAMVCFGSCDSIVAFLSGLLQKCVGRRVIFGFGAVMHLVVLICMYLWKPSADGGIVVFIFAGALGAVDAVWQSQSCSLCGLLFKEREAAFASLRMYESLGFSVAATYAQYIGMDVKIFLLMGALVLAILSYAILEKTQTSKLRNPVMV